MNIRIRVLDVIQIGLLILLAALPVQAELPQGKNQVLIIHSYHSGLTWTDDIMNGIRDTFARSGSDIQISAEYLDTRRYPKSELSNRIRGLVISKSKETIPNLVMVSDNNALELVLEQRKQLFDDIPIVFCGINDFSPAMISKYSEITGVAEDVSIIETVNLALQLHPHTREIIVIGRTSVAADQYNRDSFVAALPKLPSHLKVTFWDDLPGPELKARLEKLKSGSVLFINGLITDPTGRQMMYGETTKWISRYTNIPAYSLWDVYLGYGIVGGKLVSGYRQGQMAGKLALRILNGESANHIPVIAGLDANRYMFDYRQLERFHIPLSKLPPGTIFVNRPDSFYDKHKTLVWATLSIVSALGFLVVLLGIAVVRQHRAERALKISEERTRLFFERQIVGMAIISPEKGWLQVNDRLCRMLGYSREELVHLTWADLTYPDDLAPDIARFDRLLTGEINEYALEKRFIRKDGAIIVTNLSVGCVRNESGSVDYVLVLLEDITERKRAEESLLLEKERLDALLQLGLMTDSKETDIIHFAMESAVRLTSSTLGYVAFMNDDETVLTMFAWSKTAMQECAVKDKPITYPVSTTGLWGEAVRQRKPIITNDYSAPNPYKKGLPRGHVHIARHMNIPVFDGNRIVIVAGVGNKANEYDDGDVHQLTLLMSGLWTIIRKKRSEEEREKLQKQLNQAQKMESVGRLAGGVAHDFNNMLTAILGNAELAMSLCNPSEPIHARLKVIEESALRSADLVRQLLSFARQQTVAPKVLDVNDIAASILKMLQRLMGEDIDLIWMPKTGLWPVKIDPSQIDQLLANLCVNARDAITGVGKVTIETENAAFDEAYCAVHPGFVPGEYVMLAVSDDGDGIDKDDLDHIFEPFFTTKESGRGTGLGLATVYGIVKQSDGFINVYSEPGKGSTFKIYLPRFEGETSEPAAESPAELPRGRGETVLLVEDEAMILNVGREMLEALGYKVLTADTPSEALRQVRTYAGEIQLVLTDVVMPEMNGWDLAKLLREIKPGLKCLFASGYTANVIAHHSVLDEGVVFIQKPFLIKNLAAKVREALERE